MARSTTYMGHYVNGRKMLKKISSVCAQALLARKWKILTNSCLMRHLQMRWRCPDGDTL
jgi:hypothetical protein